MNGKNNKVRRRADGFTLLEMMLSVAVTAIGIMTMVSALTVFDRSYKRFKQVVNAQTAARTVSEVMSGQFNLSGYFLAAPRSMPNAADGCLGSQPLDFAEYDPANGSNVLTLQGNFFNLYAPVQQLQNDKIILVNPPDISSYNCTNYNCLPPWSSVDDFHPGALAVINTGKRSTQITSSNFVFSITSVETSTRTINLGTSYSLGSDLMAANASYVNNIDNFVLVSEVMRRRVAAPVYQPLNPVHKLYLEAMPGAPNLPVAEFVVSVDYTDADKMRSYMDICSGEVDPALFSEALPSDFQNYLLSMGVGTRTAEEFLEGGGRTTGVQDGLEGIDLDGDTRTKAIIRRLSVPVTFPSYIGVNPSFRYEAGRARYEQTREACKFYGLCF